MTSTAASNESASQVTETESVSAESGGECEPTEASLHVEYQSAISRLDAYGDTGRRDLMFVTAAQAAIIGIVGDRLASLDGVRDWALVGVAFAVALLGCNSQWRLLGQVQAFMDRARWIERRLGMSLLNVGDAAFAKRDEQGRPRRKLRKPRLLSPDDEGLLDLKWLRPRSIARTFLGLYVLIIAFWVYVALSNCLGSSPSP